MGAKTYNKEPREAMLPFLFQGLTDLDTARWPWHNSFPKRTPIKKSGLGEPVAGSDSSAQNQQNNVRDAAGTNVTLVAMTWNQRSSLSWRGLRR